MGQADPVKSLLGEVQTIGWDGPLGLSGNHQLRSHRPQNLARLRCNRIPMAWLNLSSPEIIQRAPKFGLQIAGVKFFLI
jgi:hypothetical protein